MWNQFPLIDTCLGIQMFLASEITFEFILAYFMLFFGHFWPKHLFGFKRFLFLCVYN